MKVYLGKNGHPFIDLFVIGQNKDILLTCMIDTGFAGGIAIPSYLQTQFDSPILTKQLWKLADGSEKTLGVYMVKAKLKEAYREMEAIFVDRDEGLVGIEFLLDKHFVLDIKRNLVSLE